MGEIVRLKCPNGDYEEEFFLGVGMLDHPAERLLGNFEGSAALAAEEILSDPGKAAGWEYERVLGQCVNCRRLKTVPALMEKAGSSRKIYVPCECGGDMRLWLTRGMDGESESELPVCPVCGTGLNAEKAGMWD